MEGKEGGCRHPPGGWLPACGGFDFAREALRSVRGQEGDDSGWALVSGRRSLCQLQRMRMEVAGELRGAKPQGMQGVERGAWVEGCMTSQGRFLRRSAQDALPVFEDGLHVEKPRERRGWRSGWWRLAGAWGSRNTEQGEVAEAGATPGLWWPPWPSLSSLSPLPSPSHHCQCTCDADFKAPL